MTRMSHADALTAEPSPVVGFDAAARAWMTEADPSVRRVPLPMLRGRLLVDVAAQARAIDAAGQPMPWLVAAMLLPGAVGDIVRMMRFCDEHGIVVTSADAVGHPGPGPVVRIRADALGRARPMLRVVGSDH